MILREFWKQESLKQGNAEQEPLLTSLIEDDKRRTGSGSLNKTRRADRRNVNLGTKETDSAAKISSL